MRLLHTLPLLLLLLASCGSYYSDIPKNNPSYLPATEYVRIGREHVKKKYPKFKLPQERSIGSGHPVNATPHIKRNNLGQILDEKVHLRFTEPVALPKGFLPISGCRGCDQPITRESINFFLSPRDSISLRMSKRGSIIESTRDNWPPAFWPTELKPSPSSQAPLSKRPKLTN